MKQQRTKAAHNTRIFVTASPEMHRAVKMAAAGSGTTVTNWVRGLIERALKTRKAA